MLEKTQIIEEILKHKWESILLGKSIQEAVEVVAALLFHPSPHSEAYKKLLAKYPQEGDEYGMKRPRTAMSSEVGLVATAEFVTFLNVVRGRPWFKNTDHAV